MLIDRKMGTFPLFFNKIHYDNGLQESRTKQRERMRQGEGQGKLTKRKAIVEINQERN